MLKKYIVVILAVVLCLTSVANASDAVKVEDVPDLIQKRYENLKTFKAEFVQDLTNVASGEVDTRKGRIWFKQPSQVRWETTSPEKELLVIGQDAAWNYIEDEEVAIKYSVNNILSSKTVLRFISGQANLKEDFVVKTDWEGAGDVRERWGKGFTVLQLLPKEPEPGMVLAFIGVEPDTGLLRQVMVVDFYGNGNEVRLSNIEMDVDIKPEQFSFNPPEGIDVEDNTKGF